MGGSQEVFLAMKRVSDWIQTADVTQLSEIVGLGEWYVRQERAKKMRDDIAAILVGKG